MGYKGIKLKNDIVINKLYTVHYFEYSKSYKFPGESHDFWELVYVDKGEIIATANDKQIQLSQGNMIFHKPNEWHTIQTNGKTASNTAIVSFECNSEAMKFFEGKVFPVSQEQKNLVAKIVAEYTNAFSTPLNDPYTTRLDRKKEQIFCSEQLICQYICELLISFIRQSSSTAQRTLIKINAENATTKLLVDYMLENISRNITISDLTKYINSNKMTITKAFKNCFGMSPMEYFIYLKVETAKKYLREENYNITQISELLGYSRVHYFSAQFKKKTGMSPTEYSMSAKSISKIKDLERTE